MKRTPLRRKSKSASALLKDKIQALVREIVMKRDGGCVLREKRHCGAVLGLPGHVYQADHLITRAHTATYADTELIVCLCKRCHGWKHWNKEAYDVLVKTVLPERRVKLWERCEKERQQGGTLYRGSNDWRLVVAALEQEAASYV